MSDITRKKIVFFGEDSFLYCDGKCHKAWGINSRPRVKENGKEYWISDNEFDYAPDDPGTYEGGCGKPCIKSGRDMNKWCARECERSKVVGIDEKLLKSNLLNFNKRVLLD